jgi:hypothetical protein
MSDLMVVIGPSYLALFYEISYDARENHINWMVRSSRCFIIKSTNKCLWYLVSWILLHMTKLVVKPRWIGMVGIN